MYSRPSDSRPLSFIYIEDDGSGCTTNSDRYMRINMGKCRENKDSQMECPAMADWGTSSDSSAGKLLGFLDVVLLLSATFYLKIILKGKKFTSRKFHILLLKTIVPKWEIQAQVSWRVSWCDSTVLSHFPSQNHFTMEKISTSRKFRIFLPKKIARLRGPCSLLHSRF